MFSVGTIPASANTGRSAAWTPKQAPRGSGAGAGPETPEVAARSTGPPGGALSDHGDPDEAPTGEWRVRGPAFSFAPHPSSARRAMSLRPLRSLPRVPRPSPLVPTSTQSPFCAHASRSPAVSSGLSGAGPGHCAHLSQVAGPVDGGDPDPVAGFLNWCRRVGLELSPKVSERAGGRRTRGGARAALTSPPPAQVAVSRQGTVAGYGMVARESVQAGELLFVVPRAALLSQHTCSIGGLLERGGHGGGLGLWGWAGRAREAASGRSHLCLPQSEARCRASRAGCHCCWRSSTSCRPRPHAGGRTLRSGPSWAAWSTRCSGENFGRGWGTPAP